MIILGIDYSKNSPGVVALHLDDDLEVVTVDYVGFTTVKKNEKLGNLIHYKKDTWRDDIAKAQGISAHISAFIHRQCKESNRNPHYAAFEGYAYAAKGKVFDIAESTMVTKQLVYSLNSQIRIYDPNSIKKFATGHGNADKVRMGESFNAFDGLKPDVSKLADAKSPKEDIVDAFFAAKLLQLELKLRRGLLAVKDLPEKQIEVFNRVTKAYPENILVRPFIQQNAEEFKTNYYIKKGGNNE